MAAAPHKSTRPNSVCPQCGSEFSCGAKAGNETCWCADLPPLVTRRDEASASCYCINCLRQKIFPDRA
ncbi:MAG: cysteine-rich CWC family protein [Rhodocyclaceae bacterium]|nr:cysteine-rich CWC family protein [Rhodocyclaceae bacterium]